MGFNLFPWLMTKDEMKIHPLTIGNDAYEIVDEAISYLRNTEGVKDIEVVETPELDISDCIGGYEGAKVKTYLLKCKDSIWTALQIRIRSKSAEEGVPFADMDIV